MARATCGSWSTELVFMLLRWKFAQPPILIEDVVVKEVASGYSIRFQQGCRFRLGHCIAALGDEGRYQNTQVQGSLALAAEEMMSQAPPSPDTLRHVHTPTRD
eukprot:25947-Eustigmatos_ZCMA.PRE.1